MCFAGDSQLTFLTSPTDAAAEMAAGGATCGGAGATSFGAATGVSGGSGTFGAAPLDMSSGGVLDHIRSLLLLRPVGLHDVWLRKVRFSLSLRTK